MFGDNLENRGLDKGRCLIPLSPNVKNVRPV